MANKTGAAIEAETNAPEAVEEQEQLFTVTDAMKYDALWGKHFVPIDPKTGKVHATAKECFWEIIGQYPASKYGENMNAPVMHFELQRFWRNQWYEARANPTDNKPGGARKNVPWTSTTPDGELIPGCQQISYPELLEKFKIES